MSASRVFFWQTEKGKKIGPGCLSQWSKCGFVVDGVYYRYAEQYMMAEKARLFEDDATLDKIMDAKSPMIIKRLGRAVKGRNGGAWDKEDVAKWDAVRSVVVERGNFAKFSQNDALKEYLLLTGDALLAEASPYDAIWGIGIDAETAEKTPQSKWPGKNLLGKALMNVREKLKSGAGDSKAVAADKKLLKEFLEAEASQRKIKEAESRAKTPTVSQKAKTQPPAAGLPGATRYSTVIRLAESPTDRKWNLFLREGPYWNYLVNYIQRRNIFHGRRDRVEEAVMNACERIAKFLLSKRYKYPEEGKGYFRGFIKTVAFRTALDLYREISRQEQMLVKESGADTKPEFDKMKDDMDKATASRREKIEMAKPVQGIKDAIVPSSEHDLDVYDASAGFNRNVAPAEKKQAGKMHCISSLDDNPFSDDEAPVNYNPADLFDFMTKVSKEDLGWVQKLQIHVLYIALGYVLTNTEVSVERRELLRLRYGLDMKPKDIYEMTRFASKSRDAFDAQMCHATDELRKEVASWWKLVSPKHNDFADDTVLKFWRELGRTDERAKMAIELQDKAIAISGRIE